MKLWIIIKNLMKIVKIPVYDEDSVTIDLRTWISDPIAMSDKYVTYHVTRLSSCPSTDGR